MTKILLPVAALALLLPAGAGAGSVDTRPVRCTSAKTGGQCQGTLRGFRRATDPEAFAAFVENGADTGLPRRQFVARLGDFYGSCDVPEDVSDATWTQLMTNPDLLFAVGWSAPDYDCTLRVTTADSRLLEIPIVLR